MPRTALFALAVCAVWALACGAESSSSGGAESTPAPDFTLPALEGGEITLSELRGKTVVIDFWATWCPPCEFQIPVLNTVYEAHRGEGVEILGVSVDTGGFEVVRPYAEQHQIGYPVLLGTEALAREFGAPGFPALVVVAPSGAIAHLHVGLIEQADLEAVLAEISGGPRVAGDPT